MLTFVGLGLWDERSVTVEGRDALRAADRVFAEFYTSRLAGTTVEALAAHHGVDVEVRDRAGVERDPEPILAAAERAGADGTGPGGGESGPGGDGATDVAFLTAGDTMISTTHVDLRVRAAERGIDTRVIHGVTAQSAASSLTGLQNYRFGKAVTLPFEYAHGADGTPASVLDGIEANRERGLHTLVYLDIKVAGSSPAGPGEGEPDEFMTADEAAAALARDWDADAVGVAVARAGSPDPVVAADRLGALAEREFGDPLHMLVIPGELHHLEAEALATLAGCPRAALPEF